VESNEGAGAAVVYNREKMEKRFDRIAIVGLGLIGGSLAAALKGADAVAGGGAGAAAGGSRPEGAGVAMGVGASATGGAPFIYAYDLRAESAALALEFGYADATPSRDELSALLAGGEVGLVVLAVPAGALGEWFSFIADSGYAGVVTDVSSTKAGAAKLAHALLRYPERFVPGHPMAGSEQSGLAAASGDLFAGAYWILTPDGGTDAEAYGGVHALLSSVGARVISVSPDEHDSVVAIVSHVPHVAAAALVILAGRHAGEDGDLLRLAAGGFKDTTRVASGSADLWTGILMDNAEIVAGELAEYGRVIADFERFVRAGDAAALRALLSDAAEVRGSLPAKWVPGAAALTVVRVPMDDRRGIIAEITAAAGRAGCNIEAIDIDHITEARAELELVLTGEGDAGAFVAALEAVGFRPRLRGLGA
jgi:prephenate dehydrogenase